MRLLGWRFLLNKKPELTLRLFCKIKLDYACDFMADQPAYLAVSTSSASMRRSWLYLAARSERALF
jgi:hypothetical protein